MTGSGYIGGRGSARHLLLPALCLESRSPGPPRAPPFQDARPPPAPRAPSGERQGGPGRLPGRLPGPRGVWAPVPEAESFRGCLRAEGVRTPRPESSRVPTGARTARVRPRVRRPRGRPQDTRRSVTRGHSGRCRDHHLQAGIRNAAGSRPRPRRKTHCPRLREACAFRRAQRTFCIRV